MKLGGFNLQLNNDNNGKTIQDENQSYEQQSIKIEFQFINENEQQLEIQNITSQFKPYQDIGWVKHFIAQKFNVQYSDFELFFAQKQMHNVLSLSDFQGLTDGSTIQIVVLKNKEGFLKNAKNLNTQN
ncbi:hypothetical protein PPERSA_06390 [Pseudocohnilembus persalinus]|uniref:Ubiquitin-like domain-containing protein n=1 Tax=Pseudocohnilembus persalinus TaxID=266149 RepID=A0A0V0QIQ5_PSEPJ|nr:hypothetical protein PPERSA_06390 [Pseudocohnilembus persalinus]|eukprot:KRX02195.1 hypothetical protein PPERSA_06390 [Pseudocohnilembus persalinus]